MPEALTAVIDSTVLVSAFLTEGGVSAALLRYAREGVFLVFLSEDILTETQHTLAYSRIRERYNYTDVDVTDFLNRLRVAVTIVTEIPQVTEPQSPRRSRRNVRPKQKLRDRCVLRGSTVFVISVA